jgi:hypothetical protein
MSNYKTILNPFTGQLQLVNDAGLLFFKDSVSNVAALPVSGNTINDARIVNDTHNLYVWSGTSWINQGDIMNLDWSTIENRPSSTPADIDNAVSLKHTQNTDTILKTLPTGDNILVDGIASADSIFSAGYEASKAVDGNLTTKWNSDGSAFPHYWKYDLGVGITKKICRLNIYTYSDYAGGILKDFILQGSNDDTNWDTIYTGIAAINIDKFWQYFAFVNLVAYRYYKIIITSNYRTDSLTGFYEIQMKELTTSLQELINNGELINDLTIQSGVKIGERHITLDGIKLDGIDDGAANLGRVKSDIDIADALTKKHTQGTEQGLDTGGANATTAADVKDAVDNRLDTVTGNMVQKDGGYNRRVDPAGNDVTGDGSIALPYKTIARALLDVPRYINAFVSITLNDGTYTIADVTGIDIGFRTSIFETGITIAGAHSNKALVNIIVNSPAPVVQGVSAGWGVIFDLKNLTITLGSFPFAEAQGIHVSGNSTKVSVNNVEFVNNTSAAQSECFIVDGGVLRNTGNVIATNFLTGSFAASGGIIEIASQYIYPVGSDNNFFSVMGGIIFKIATPEIDTKVALIDEATPTVDLDDAVSLKHTQNTDTALSTDKLVVSGNNVGIGVPDPDELLEVNGNVHIGGKLYTIDNGDADSISMRVNNDSSGYAGFAIKSLNGINWLTQFYYQCSDSSFRIYMAGADRFFIDSTGNINIPGSIVDGSNNFTVALAADAVLKKHTQNTDLYLDTAITNTLYVDGNRSDTYTSNGSITKPFKKIQDAIDATVSPSATNKYVIEVSPGAYYTDAIVINKAYITFRSCGVQGARISGAITVTNPIDPTPEQITFIGFRISGGLTCNASHICINVIDCNVTGTAWILNPTIPTDDEWLQVWGGIWYADVTLTNIYTYLMGGGYYSTFAATNKEFNINNADINTPFQVTLNGTIIASAYGNRAGSSLFILNTGSTLYMDADTEGGSVLTMSGGTLIRTTKAGNIVNIPAGNIIATDLQAAINELDTKKYTQETEIKIKVFAQSTEPILAADNNMAIWHDISSGSDKVWLIFRRGSGDQVAVELS